MQIVKRLLLTALVLAVLAGAGFSVCAHFISGEYIRGRILAMTAKFGSPPEFETPEVASYFPPRLVFGKIRWQGSIGAISAKFGADGCEITLDIFSLLLDRPAIGELSLKKPELILAGSAGPAPARRAHAGHFPEIGRVVTQDGTVVFETGAGVLRLDDLRLASSPKSGHENSLQCDFVLNWSPENSAPVSGNFALKALLRYYAPNLIFREGAATFTATNGGVFSAFSPLRARFDGAFNVGSLAANIHYAQLEAPGLRFGFSGNLKNGGFLGKASIFASQGSFFPFDGRFNVSANAALSEAKLDLSDLILIFLGCVGTGEASLTFPDDAPPRVAANLKMEVLDFDLLSPGEKRAARVNPVPGGFPWPDLAVKIAFRELKAGRFKAYRANFDLSGGAGAYRLENSGARWAGGRLAASGEANLAESRYRLRLAGEKISLAEVLKQAGISGFRGGATNFELKLAAQGEIAATLSGAGRLESRKLEFDPFGEAALLLPLLGRIGKHLPHSLDSIKIAFTARDGVADFGQIQAAGPDFRCDGDAKADLARESLDARLIVKTPALELPLVFRGPFDDIGFAAASGLLK